MKKERQINWRNYGAFSLSGATVDMGGGKQLTTDPLQVTFDLLSASESLPP